jgi:hypothetical protein
VLLTVWLAGCAAMNEQECLISDWRAVGFEDGAAGRPVSTVGTYREACSQHGVAPSLDGYRAGHAEGAEVFCQPGTGFEVGRAGAKYHGVCPAELEHAFLDAYNEGRHLHQLETAVRSISSQITGKTRARERLRKDLAAKEAALVREGTSAEERVLLLSESKELARQEGAVERQIIELERERALREDDLLRYRETLAYGF